MADERDPSQSGTDPNDQQGGNAAATQTTGTAGDAGSGGNGDELERLRAEKDQWEKEKQQHLAEKTNREAERAELDQLRAQQQRAVDPDAEAYRQAYQRYLALKAQADAGEPYAQSLLEQAQQLADIKRTQMEERQLSMVPPEKRAEVERVYQQGGYQSPAKVWELMKPGWEVERKARDSDEERKRQAAAELGNRVDTSTRTVGAAEAKQRTMTYAQYNALQVAAETDPSKREAAEKAWQDKEALRLKLVLE